MVNPFYIFTKHEIYYIIAIFILGIILGATLLNLSISHQIDRLILENKSLKNKLENQKKQVEKLNKNLKKQKEHIISSIKINIETDLNEHTEQELTKKLNNILESLIGNELSEIDPLLIRNTVNQRFIHIEDKAYEVTFIYMILREETIIHLEATEK
jgi:predicted PurR-regulated permease PerM